LIHKAQGLKIATTLPLQQAQLLVFGGLLQGEGSEQVGLVFGYGGAATRRSVADFDLMAMNPFELGQCA